MRTKTIRINEADYLGFVWDGCHKIYLIESESDWGKCDAYDRAEMLPMDELPGVWRNTCPLRFINTYGTLRTIVPQFANVGHIEIIKKNGHIITTKL